LRRYPASIEVWVVLLHDLSKYMTVGMVHKQAPISLVGVRKGAAFRGAS